MEKWQTRKGHNLIDKIARFQKIPVEKRYTERVVILFTKAQLKIILDYCNENNLNKGILFRDAVVEYFEKRNVNISGDQSEDDPRQTKMF